MNDREHFEIEITYGSKATIATIYCFLHADSPLKPENGDFLTVTGEAFREPGDNYDRKVAARLATGRALQKLGRLLERHGHGRDRMLEDNRKHARIAKNARRLQMADMQQRHIAS